MVAQTDEVMTPVPRPEAVAMAEIHALRQIGDSLAIQGRLLEKVVDKVDDVRERVIALEQSGYDKRLEALKGELATAKADHKREIETVRADHRREIEAAVARINTLESERDQVKGAASVWGWLSKNAPWLFAGIAAFVAGWSAKHP